MTLPQLDGPVRDLGLAIGLLRTTAEPPGVALDPAFFSDPGRQLGSVLRNEDQREAFLDAAEALLGLPDVPEIPDLPPGQTWIPVIGGDGPLRLFVVVESASDGAVSLSLGARVQSTPPPEASVVAVVPLVRLSPGQPPALPLGTNDGVVALSASVATGVDPTPGQAGLRAATLHALIPTGGAAAVVDLNLVGLQLPGETAPHDVVLTPGDELLGQVLSLLVGLLQTQQGPAGAAVRRVLSLVGLHAGASAIPRLSLDELLEQGTDALWSWLRSLAATDGAPQAWLTELAGLLGLPASAVSGAGTELAPYSVCADLPGAAGGSRVCLTLVVGSDASGQRVLRPGVTALLRTTPATTPPAELRAELEAARITLGTVPSATALPRMRLFAHLGPALPLGTATPLVRVTEPQLVEVAALRAGFAIDDARRPLFLLEAHEVAVGADGRWPVLDLTSADAVVAAGTSVLGNIVEELVDELGVGATARSVLALLGLRAPTNPPATGWPHAVDLPGLLADPLGAVARFHAAVLRASRTDYLVLLRELRALLHPAGAPAGEAIEGDGSKATPWLLELVDTSTATDPIRGALRLRVWTAAASDGRTVVHLGASVEPVLPAFGEHELEVAYRGELLNVTLPADGEPVNLDPSVLVAHELTAELGENLALGGDGAGVAARAIEGGVRWRPDTGLQARLAVADPTVTVGGVPQPLPLPRLEYDGATLATLADLPWELVEILAARSLREASQPWLRGLPDLVGWGLGAGPPGVPGGAAIPGAGRLPLGSLVAEPAAALRAWLATRLAGEAGRDIGAMLAGALASLTSGTTTASGPFAGTITGSGEPGDPWAVRLGADGASPEVVAWLEPAGPLAAVGGGLAELPLPPDLAAALEDGGAVPAIGRLVGLLGGAVGGLPGLRGLLSDRGDIAGTLAALLDALAGSDGIVTSAAAAVGAAETVDLPGVTHLDLAEALDPGTHLPAGVAANRVVYVSGVAAPRAPWRAQGSAAVIDLATPGLLPEAFDVRAVAAGSGPWFVQLGSRADSVAEGYADGLLAQAARLRRVVVAAKSTAPGEPLALVAHGSAGHAARVVAADASGGVTHLVSVGTPHGGTLVDVLDAPATGSAAALVRSLLVALPDEEDGTLEAVAAAWRLIDTAADVTRELAPPASAPPALPAGVVHRAVRGVVARGELERGLAQLVSRAIALAHQHLLGGEEGRPGPTALAVGVRWRFSPAVPPGALSVSGIADLELARIEFGDEPVREPGAPSLAVRLALRRAGGWLVGGPDPGRASDQPRTPRVRWAEVELLTGPASRARILLHDAAALGAERPVWEIDQGVAQADPLAALLPEARVLLGRVVAAFSPQPAAGPARVAIELLRSLDLVDVAADGSVAFDADAVERFLLDPAAVLRERDDAVLETAIRDLLAATDQPDGLVAAFGGIEAVVALGATPALTVRTPEGGLDLAGGARLAGSLRAARSGVTGEVTISSAAPTGPAGRPGLTLRVEPPAAPRLVLELLEARTDLPATVELAPAPQLDLLARWAVAVLPGELARLALELLRDQRPAVEPLLHLIGLLPSVTAGARVRNPAALLADPLGWLGSPSVLGGRGAPVVPSRIIDVVDAARELLGAAGSRGELPLFAGLTLAAAEVGQGAVRVSLGPTAPFDLDGATLDAEAAVVVGADLTPAPELSADLAVLAPGTTNVLGRLEVRGTASGVTARLVVPRSGSPNLVVPLLPVAGGVGALTDLAETAVQQALPIVLDELAGQPAAIGDVVTALGDGLGIRTDSPAGRRFDAAQLRQLAASTPETLAARLRANAGSLVVALQRLAGSVLPPTLVAVDPATATATVTVVRPNLVRVVLAVPSAGPPAVRLGIVVDGLGFDVDGVTGNDLRLSARVEIDTATGLARLDAEAGIVSPAPLAGVMPLVGVRLDADPAVPDRVELGLWLDPTLSHAFVVQFPLDGSDARVVCRTVAADRTVTDVEPPPREVPSCVLDLVTGTVGPLAANLVLASEAVKELLRRPVRTPGGLPVGTVLTGSVLDPVSGSSPAEWRLRTDAFDPDTALSRALVLAGKLASALANAVNSRLAPLELALSDEDLGGPHRYGVRLGLAEGRSFPLIENPVSLGFEVDGRWDEGAPSPPGLVVRVITVDGQGNAEITPGFAIRGAGLRLGGANGGPLLATGVGIRSIALHGSYARDRATFERGAGHFELDRLSLPLTSAGGNNAVARSLLASDPGSGGGDTAPVAPAFSPAIVVAKEGAADPTVRLRAGPPPGPWWLPIQRSFGPLYVEQVGLRTVETNGRLQSVGVLLDGGVRIAGLAAQVDDLEVSAPWASVTDPTTWRVDLAGLGIGYSAAGVTLAGALRRGSGDPPDYLGLLVARFGVYGLSAVAGYGSFPDPARPGGRYSSLFVAGALNAPLGGPPAFFVTGIGGGAGINRRLILPASGAEIASYPLVTLFTSPERFAASPLTELTRLGERFPPERGSFWFAAGLRFTSFGLLDTLAVISIAVATGPTSGVEVALLGLSRLGLPTPEAPLAQAELALQARFSSRQGVIEVIAQLTDNSFLLSRDCRLTGGFAYKQWLASGQFVVTLGGYHPAFAKPAGFPDVPRIGYRWGFSSAIVIKGEAYFALTSSCVMAGARFEATLDAGFVWGSLIVGIDAIIYFDPFWFDVHGYAQVSVGVRIRICVPFLGCAQVQLSFSIGADLHVQGPELRGSARLDLDVTSFTVRFGATNRPAGRDPLAWQDFADKYLLGGGDGGVLTATVVAGGVTEAANPGGSAPPDGSAGRPWRLDPEFTLSVATRAAANVLELVGAPADRTALPARVTGERLDLGPMQHTGVRSTLRVAVRDRNGAVRSASLTPTPAVSAVPKGVWRYSDPAPLDAEVRDACTGTLLAAIAIESTETAVVQYDRVDVGLARPLPLAAELAHRTESQPLAEAAAEAAGATAALDAPTLLERARERLALDRTGDKPRPALSPLALTTFAAERVAPPRLVPLTEGMVSPEPEPVETETVELPPPPPDPDPTIAPPELVAALRLPPAQAPSGKLRTTVRPEARTVTRVAPPSLEELRRAPVGPLAARLLRAAPAAVALEETVVLPGGPPATGWAGALSEERGGLFGADVLAEAEKALLESLTVRPGDVYVARLPNSAFDVPGAAGDEARPALRAKGDAAVRVVVFDAGDRVLADVTGDRLASEVPAGADRIVIVGVGTSVDRADGLAGWHAGTRLVQASSRALVGPGCVVLVPADPAVRRRQNVTTGLRRAAEATGSGVVTTRLPAGARTIVIVLETIGEVDERLDGLAAGFEGARRTGEAPLVVTAGTRAHVLLEVEPLAEAESVTVTVGSDERWRLAGVLATDAGREGVAARLAASGLDELAAPFVVSPLGGSRLVWRGG